ncbi:hypothetical protein NQZ79_g8781 [Umbelopsis isabellina]|nr:hypothetical protein NQZ79_g8781 [Umbelopsis isabellina]
MRATPSAPSAPPPPPPPGGSMARTPLPTVNKLRGSAASPPASSPVGYGGGGGYESNDPPSTEGGGRWSFRSMQELPAPNGRFSKSHKVYPSGERSGNGKLRQREFWCDVGRDIYDH